MQQVTPRLRVAQSPQRPEAGPGRRVVGLGQVNSGVAQQTLGHARGAAGDDQTAHQDEQTADQDGQRDTDTEQRRADDEGRERDEEQAAGGGEVASHVVDHRQCGLWLGFIIGSYGRWVEEELWHLAIVVDFVVVDFVVVRCGVVSGSGCCPVHDSTVVDPGSRRDQAIQPIRPGDIPTKWEVAHPAGEFCRLQRTADVRGDSGLP